MRGNNSTHRSYAPIIVHPPGGGGGEPQASTTLYRDFMGDLNDYFTQEVGEMREVWFPKALHHRELTGDFVH